MFGQMSESTRRDVLIADDHSVYRAGLAHILQRIPGLADIVEVENFDDALDTLARKPFFLALFDLDMPGMVGPSTLHEVRATYPDLAVIVVSACVDQAVIDSVVPAVDAFISKTTSLPAMWGQIQAVLAHRQKAKPDLSAEPLETCDAVKQALPSRCLTARQMEVLVKVERGLSNKEIARLLNISPGTVKIHIAALLAFYGLRNRTELALKSRELSRP